MKKSVFIGALALAGVSGGMAAAGTLDDVKARGTLNCGVSTGLVGFAAPDANGEWQGFDVAVCRAVAAAVLGDASAVEFVPTTGKTRFTALASGEIDMLAFCEAENLRLAVDQLSPFAHWLTPVNMPKRFDTHFYLAPAPDDAGLSHDGRESVDSVWITPDQALADAAAKRRTVIFPTRLNLEKLAQNKSVESALAAARASPVVPVLPRVERHDGGRTLHIPLEAGYGAASFFVRE